MLAIVFTITPTFRLLGLFSIIIFVSLRTEYILKKLFLVLSNTRAKESICPENFFITYLSLKQRTFPV